MANDVEGHVALHIDVARGVDCHSLSRLHALRRTLNTVVGRHPALLAAPLTVGRSLRAAFHVCDTGGHAKMIQILVLQQTVPNPWGSRLLWGLGF